MADLSVKQQLIAALDRQAAALAETGREQDARWAEHRARQLRERGSGALPRWARLLAGKLQL